MIVDKFLMDNNIILFIKGHTRISLTKSHEEYDNIYIYANDRDGYPL